MPPPTAALTGTGTSGGILNDKQNGGSHVSCHSPGNAGDGPENH
jgi:hypothetical protein